MFKLVLIAAAMLMSSLSVAFAIPGGRSTAFYNSHTYTVGPNGGPAKVVPKQGMMRRNPANRLLYR
jgi:hypothetical protein